MKVFLALTQNLEFFLFLSCLPGSTFAFLDNFPFSSVSHFKVLGSKICHSRAKFLVLIYFFSQRLHLILVLYILFLGFISCQQFFIMWHFLIHSYETPSVVWITLSSILFKKNTWVIYFLRCCESEHIFLFHNFLSGNSVIESQHFPLKNSAGIAQHY